MSIVSKAAPRRLAPGSRKRRKWPFVLMAVGLLFFGLAVFIQANVRLPSKPWALDDGAASGPLGGLFSGIKEMFTGSGDDAQGAGGELSGTLPGAGAADAVPAGKTRKEGVYTFLLAGTDEDGLRTDTIMAASLNIIDNTMALVSIPRDIYVPTASRSVKKINGAYGGKYMDRLLDEVELVAGFRPDYWMLVNLDGFVALIDAIDGIEYDVPRDMKYSDPAQNLYIDLKKGHQHLNGDQAIQLARYRKGYVTQDLERVQVQRGIIVAVIKKMMTPAGLLKIPTLKDVIVDNVSTDLKWGEIAALALELNKVDMETGAVSGTIPATLGSINGGSYLFVNKKETAELINATVNPFEEGMTEADILPE